jgi:hypothetical protein
MLASLRRARPRVYGFDTPSTRTEYLVQPMVVLEFAVWRQPPAGASRFEQRVAVDVSAAAEKSSRS